MTKEVSNHLDLELKRSRHQSKHSKNALPVPPPLDEEDLDVIAFDAGMASEGESIPWDQVQKDLGLK